VPVRFDEHLGRGSTSGASGHLRRSATDLQERVSETKRLGPRAGDWHNSSVRLNDTGLAGATGCANTLQEHLPRSHAGDKFLRCPALEQTLDFLVVEYERVHEIRASLEHMEQRFHAPVSLFPGFLFRGFLVHGFRTFFGL
jgi:hypothetical protein